MIQVLDKDGNIKFRGVGFAGPTGPQGATGHQGTQGTQGSQGSASTVVGPTGATGPQGSQGSQGSQSTAAGTTGPTGPQGTQGSQGSASTAVGPTGATGPQGSQGSQGSIGSTGNRGSQGSQGSQGTGGGATGATGPQGSQGSQGSIGPQGSQGSAGSGATITIDNSVFVTKNGNDGTAMVNRLDLPFLTIQAAVIAASSGDTVIVYPGTYDETITLADGVNFYFYEGAIVNCSTGNAITDNNVAVTSVVDGYGQFITSLPASSATVILIQNTGTIFTIRASLVRADAGASSHGIQSYGTVKYYVTLTEGTTNTGGMMIKPEQGDFYMEGGEVISNNNYCVLIGIVDHAKFVNVRVRNLGYNSALEPSGGTLTEVIGCYLFSTQLFGLENAGGFRTYVRDTIIESAATTGGGADGSAISFYGGDLLELDNVRLICADPLAKSIETQGQPNKEVRIYTSSFATNQYQASPAIDFTFGQYNLLIDGVYSGHAPLDTDLNATGPIGTHGYVNPRFLGTGASGSGTKFLADNQQWTTIISGQGTQGTQGSLGPTGATGAQGTQGTQGSLGATGATGPQGSQGSLGPTGATGAQGSQGSQGSQSTAVGTPGSQGTQGTQGSLGPTGATGPQGSQGTQGTQGSLGPTGATGPQGSQGSQGSQSTAPASPGSQGTQGTQGSLGPTGATGATGAQGTQGTQGSLGPTGATGAQGTQGSLGPTGAQGSQGTQGSIGATGSTGQAADSLNWNFAVATGATNPGTGNFRFDTTGAAIANIYINENATGSVNVATWLSNWVVSTNSTKSYVYIRKVADPTVFVVLKVTSETDNGAWDTFTVSVVNSNGTLADTDNCFITFVPAGDRGSQGTQGTQGSLGATGATGATGAQGTQGTQGSLGATGATGATGPQGTQGTQGSLGATGATGATGAQGTQGSQGSLGPTGATGATGQSTMLINAVTGPSYTFGASDAGAAVSMNGTGTMFAYIPLNSDVPLNVGDTIVVRLGTGASNTAGTTLTVTGASSGVSVNGQSRILSSIWSELVLIQESATNSWWVASAPKGATGATGPQGTQGSIGVQGSQGTQGSLGPTGAQGTQGTQGSVGATGATGQAADSMNFNFAIATGATNPGTGNFRFDSTGVNIANIYINENATGSVNVATWLSKWTLSTNSTKSYVYIRKVADPTVWIVLQVTALTDNGAWDTFALTNIASNGTFADGDNCFVTFVPTGDRGSQGTQGTIGVQGPQGTQGTVGSQGSQGSAGTNFNITPNITSLASSSTPTPNANSDQVYQLTAQTVTGTFQITSGTANNGQLLIIQITASGATQNVTWPDATFGYTAHFAWGASAGPLSLPLALPKAKTTWMQFQYDTSNSLNRWVLINKLYQGTPY